MGAEALPIQYRVESLMIVGARHEERIGIHERG